MAPFNAYKTPAPLVEQPYHAETPEDAYDLNFLLNELPIPEFLETPGGVRLVPLVVSPTIRSRRPGADQRVYSPLSMHKLYTSCSSLTPRCTTTSPTDPSTPSLPSSPSSRDVDKTLRPYSSQSTTNPSSSPPLPPQPTDLLILHDSQDSSVLFEVARNTVSRKSAISTSYLRSRGAMSPPMHVGS